jgi:peptidoglycan/xylan/chitin deacetylase (PgdA/CDA1 family)
MASGAESPGVSTTPVGQASEVGHGPRAVPAVALTFHGAGPLPIARAVLNELRRGGVQVTVLAVGSWLDSEPAAARLVLDQGHELGNHTAHHLPMRSLPAGTALAEITGCAHSLRRLTGGPGRWFRASGTQHTTPVIRAAAAAAGYPVCLSYDVDSLDWRDIPPPRITSTVMAVIRPGSIVSMHLGHPGTVAAIGPLLDALSARRLHPVTVSELLW